MEAGNFIQKETPVQSVNFAKLLRTFFFTEQLPTTVTNKVSSSDVFLSVKLQMVGFKQLCDYP